MEESVTISKKEYEELLAASNFLNALYAAGVDGWSGYETAQELRDDE